ncbi:MAG: hypothetical protein WKF97_13005 [Chitinophagaceae bacterium]
MRKYFLNLSRCTIALLLWILVLAPPGYAVVADPEVSIVTDRSPGLPAVHGLKKLTDALLKKNISFEKAGSLNEAHGKMIIVTGLSEGGGAAAEIGKSGGHHLPDSAEALTIWKTSVRNKSVWVISGFDDRGLMYALLDVASRIGWSTGRTNLFSRVVEITEKADVKERAVVIYTMNRAYWESRFYDEAYWTRYLDMMANDRLNMLEVGFGFENGGFLAPAYPYFFNVDSFADVRMGDITPEQQKKNLDAFNRLIQMCHDRGIGFRVGFWDHIYRGGYQSNKDMPEQVNSQVQGVTADNMIAYTKVALAKFIDLVPHLDGILFRAHDESGLKKGEQMNFWKGVFDMLKEKAPRLVVDLHAKEVSDSIVHEGQDRGLPIRMSTKYWMEQMGLPFHPTHTNRITDNNYRRHGYGDMLNYDERYKVFYRIWGGTTRVLLWGDPEYARRFAASTHIHDGAGFGVNEPLTTKMHAQPHDAKPFGLLKPKYRYYDYEFERYWLFYGVFGRMGYNPATKPDIWEEEFRLHFGVRTGPLIKNALYRASWVLPRIVASCFPLVGFPIASGWAEKQHFGDLPDYANTTPSDVQQFASFNDEAKILMEKGETAKMLPSRNSVWFKQTSDQINQFIGQAEKEAGNNPNKELISTVTDLKILSNLALYHSRRIPAAVCYRLYENTRDVTALDDAIRYEKNAIDAWNQIVEAAGDVYADTLMMGPRKRTLVGHWKQELTDLETGFAKLEQLRKNYQKPDSAKLAPLYKPAANIDYTKLFQITHRPVAAVHPGQPITLSVKVTAASGLKWVHLLYREVNQYKEFKTLDMHATGEKDVYEATIPGGDITSQWDLMYLVEVMDKNKNGIIYPDLDKQTPYVVVKVSQ